MSEEHQELIAGLDPDFVEMIGDDLDFLLMEELGGGTVDAMTDLDYEFLYSDFARPRLGCYF